MAENILIIANPISGGGRGRSSARRAADQILAEGGQADIAFTNEQGEATDLAIRARKNGVHRIAACGGDGTIHEVIGAIAGSNVELGLVPCGRGNDFARALGIPTDPESAGSILTGGAVRRIDLGQVNGRYFGTVLTMGFDSEVARLVYEKAVPFKGTAAYVMGVLKMLASYSGISARLEGDFGVLEQPVLLAATGNTSSYGGGMKIVPGASPDDGLLEVCHVEMMSTFGVLKLLPTVFWGGHVGKPGVTITRTTSLKVDTAEPVWMFADGEPVCQTPARIKVIVGALSVVVPCK
ncbi:MAG: diacylglycerol kinase family protein [Gemmatimonadota bacterium]|nr:diacylglycerol kinase family protein [Gemmatimonadota bacterium]